MPGLLWRSIMRRRKPGRQRATALADGAKYHVKVTMDGRVYEERPDGRRRAGVKA
ncbi:hypothetical protein LCGC14_1284030 [marine sediment metagenome]|uniref:Uncharacterized protein n=1 Tax=marine sediment metagenome TaxID=412755 RepID=A0A0F9KW37_9ZZZZ